MAERIAASRIATKAGAGYAPGRSDSAGLGARGLAYLIDSVFLLVLAMLFFAIGGAVLLQRTDGGEINPTDADIWAFIGIFMVTVPVWLTVNLVLGVRRGQTLGQSITGIVAQDQRGAPLGPIRRLVYWLALHPLLFHPIIGVFWLCVAYLAVVKTANDILLYGSLSMALLCLAAPIAGIVFALADPRHRAIHDRIAGVKVVRLE